MNAKEKQSESSASGILLPLALAQFVCSFAASNMNVSINSIAKDIGTDISGVQTTITLFTLTMAALMIPGSILSDIWGRKRCFILGLTIYGLGAIIGALANNLSVLTIGYSLFEGVGSALLIPPVYILATIAFTNLQSRARAFGTISAMGGIGGTAGPLVGGLVTTAISWRASFLLQALIVGYVIFLGRKIVDPVIAGEKPKFDLLGAFLSAAGLFFIVIGILQAKNYGWLVASQDFVIGNTVVIPQGSISPLWVFIGIGAAFLLIFFLHVRSWELAGKKPLLSTKLFKNSVSNLGLITQNIQWLVLMGANFVVSVYMQTVRGFTAIQTGLTFLPAIIGLLLSSARARNLSQKYPQRILIIGGFITTITGLILLLVLGQGGAGLIGFFPGLFLFGVGIGVMLTSSVNVVQSSFPEKEQGEISGLSRSVSNLGSSLGTAIAGTILVSAIALGSRSYALALIVLAISALIGLAAGYLLPSAPAAASSKTPQPAA